MPTIFKKITDLTPSIVLNGTEVMEMVHNPGGPEEESQSVTPNQLAAFVAQTIDVTTGGVVIVTSSPLGSLTANPGRLVFDSIGTALWLKVSGSDTSGWTQLI